MVNISINDVTLHIEVEGWDKLWSFKSHFDIPMAHVRGARAVSGKEDLKALARELGPGLRAPGTELPGVIVAGTYYCLRGGRVFLDIHRPFNKVVVIDLAGDTYRKLVVEVEDPEAAVQLIQNALPAPSP